MPLVRVELFERRLTSLARAPPRATATRGEHKHRAGGGPPQYIEDVRGTWRVDPAQLEASLIDKLTEAVLDATDAPELREHTWVIVEGHDARRWGRAGKPWDESQ